MTAPLNVLSLFSGIGGLELGLERAGMITVGQVELDDYCRRVLAKHWPDVPRHDDVRTAAEWWLKGAPCDYCPRSQGWYLESFRSDYAVSCRKCGGGGRIKRPRVDVVCGGFPCQPISNAGNQLGVDDERWGWPWFQEVVRQLRPRYVLVENVAALAVRGLDIVLAGLAALGFDAEWSTVSACSMGAPHVRSRLFIVAYAAGERRERRRGAWPGQALLELEGRGQEHRRAWSDRPRPLGVAYGLPSRVDRLRAVGNAVVPQVSEYVGRLIVDHAQAVAA